MATHIDRPLQAIAATIIASLFLAGCTSPGGDSDAVTVESDGTTVTVSGVTVTIPGGAVPEGTTVDAFFDKGVQPSLESVEGVQVLADAFKITLGDELQPELPLTVEIPVDESSLSSDTPPQGTLALLVRSKGSGIPELVPAQWNDSDGTITAKVPHLSWLWPVQIDLGAIMRSVQDTVLQGLGIEYAEPDCAGKTANVGRTEYSVISPAQAWVCVSETDGSLVVEASPNSPIPFLVSSDPRAEASTSSEVSVASALSSALAGSLGFSEDGKSIMMPGTTAKFTFNGEPGPVVLGFEQYPVMLLVSILATTFDTALGGWGKTPNLDRIADIGCMQSIFDTAIPAGGMLSAETAAGVTRSFFDCAGTALEMSPAQQIILAILSAGPQFLVASALGIINELSGQGRFTATIDAVTTGSKTRFVPLDPWRDGSVGPETPIIDNATVPTNGALKACFSSSISSRTDVYRCASNGIFDPCFRNPVDPESFACLTVREELSWQIVENISADSGPVSDNGQGSGSPIAVELTDGTLCTRASGAGPVGVEGYPLWAGVCYGPHAGVWRTTKEAAASDQVTVRNLFESSGSGFWQIAISVGQEGSTAERFDVAKVYG